MTTHRNLINVFLSYAHEDEPLLRNLETHLSSLKRQGLISTWYDRQIVPGSNWAREIDQRLEQASIILLLVSADFLASDYCYQVEMKRAMARHEAGEARVVPIVVRPCDWSHTPFATLQSLPRDGKAITTWDNRDLAWKEVTVGIRQTIEDLHLRNVPAQPRQETESRSNPHSISNRPRSYIPFPLNPLFQSRPHEFEHLESLLFGPGTQLQPPRIGLIGMVGMGGVGKTQLAVQLAYRYGQRFPSGIFWMTATGTSLFEWRQQLADLAAKIEYLPLGDDPSSPENELRRARHLGHYLADHADALLILDNVEKPDLITFFFSTLVGRPAKCTILYTSRHHFTPPGVMIHIVEQLPEEAALRLLLETTRPSLLVEILAASQSIEATAARNICQGVGYLPLALMHLQGALARDRQLTLVKLADVLQARGALEIAKRHYLDAGPLTVTFELSWKQVRDEGTRRLFKLASYFPEASPIPLWLLGMAAGLGESSGIFEPLGEAYIQLQELSLIEELSEGQVRLHPLIRDFGHRLVIDEGDAGKSLLEEAGERLQAELTDLNKLEVRAQQESYWGCLEQIRAAREYAERLGTHHAELLGRIEHWLDRESYLLAYGQWWPDTIPGLFYQQLFNRSIEEEQPIVEGKAPVQWLRQMVSAGVADQALLRAFAGHTEVVTSVAFSPDGKRVLTGSNDETARLWETESGKLLMTFAGHAGEVTSVAFSPDGKWVLTGSRDQTARLWETESGKLLAMLMGHTNVVESVAFSPDGRQVLTGSFDETARLWETRSGKLLATLEGHETLVLGVGFLQHGKSIFTCDNDGTIRLWEPASGKLLMTLESHMDRVTTVVFSPDGKQVLAGSAYGIAQLSKASNGKLLTTLEGHTDGVWSVAFSPHGRQVLTGSYDKTARLWETQSGKLLATFAGHSDGVWSVAFSPDGRQVLTGSDDKTARLWEVASGEQLILFKGHSGAIRSVAFSPDGRQVLTGSWDKTARLWETRSGKLLTTLEGHTDVVRSVAFSPDGRQVLTGSWDKTARLWETQSGKLLTIFAGHSDSVGSVAFSPNGRQVFTGGFYGGGWLWEIRGGKLLAELDHIGVVNSVAFSPDGRQLLTGEDSIEDSYVTAQLWETRSGKLLTTLEGHTGKVSSVAFSPDSHLALTSDKHGRVLFWRIGRSKKRTLQGIFTAPYEIGAVYWQNNVHVLLVDTGGPFYRPHFYCLKLEGM